MTHTDDDLGKYGVPNCPECDALDAVQLATGEWVCDCGEVFTHE